MNIPVERLQKLSDAGDALLRDIFTDQRKDLLNELAKTVKELFNTEACALFLCQPGLPGHVVLEAAYSDRMKFEFAKIPPLLIQSTVRGGLTSHVADLASRARTPDGPIVNLDFTGLERNPHRTGKYQEYLTNGRGVSYLGVSLADRKGRLLGVLTLDNKKGPDDRPGQGVAFDDVDVNLARTLARKVVLLLENLRRFEAFDGIIQAIAENAGDIEGVLDQILKRAALLVYADRGDFALWDDRRHELVIRAIWGAVTKETLTIGSSAPQGFMSSLWKAQENFRNAGDVTSGPYDYYPSNPSTKSEIAVRFILGGRPIGVLNAESFHERAFDDEDRDALTLLARCAAVAVQVAGEETELAELLQSVLDRYSDDLDQTLTSVLSAVSAIYGFAGLIYVADDDSQTLRCVSAIGCEDLKTDPKKFTYAYTDKAAATKIFHNKQGDFWSKPKGNGEVSQMGLKYFEIRGPIVGVPLVFSGRAVGVLIAWGRNNPPPIREHIERLKPLAKLAAWKIAVWQSESNLRKSEDVYKDLVENLPNIMILRKDRTGTFTYVNKAFATSVGRPVEQIIGKTDNDIYPPDLAKKYRDDDDDVMRNAKSILRGTEEHEAPSDKRRRVVRYSKIPVRDAGGKDIVGIQGIFWDITDDEDRRIIELCPDAVIVHEYGKIKLINPAGVRLLGADSRRALLDKDILSFVHEEDRASVQKRIEAIVQTRIPQPQVLERWRRLDGVEIQVEVAACSFSKHDRHEVLVLAHDMTQRLQAQESFLTAVSHRRRPKSIFVCYCREDNDMMARLAVHLMPLAKEGIDVWVDILSLTPGDDWKAEIHDAIEQAKAAVLLLSPDFCASRFIEEFEKPRLIQAARQSGTQIFPVLLKPCAPAGELGKLHWVNTKPLYGLSPNDRDAIWNNLCDQIRAVLSRDPASAPHGRKQGRIDTSGLSA